MTGATDDKPTQANKLQQTASSLPQPTPTNPTPQPASSGIQTSTPQPTPPQPQQTSPQPQVTPSLNEYLSQHNIYYRDNGVPYVKGANVNTEQVQKEISILTTQYEGTQYTKGESGKLAGIVKAVKESGITLDQSSFDNTGSKSGGNTPREQYAQGLIQQKATGQFISGPTNNPQTNFSQDLGIIGLSYNPQTKVVSDPLQAKIAHGDVGGDAITSGITGLDTSRNGMLSSGGKGLVIGASSNYIPPNLSGILSGRGLSQDYGQKSLGYTQGEYSPSQVASLINSVKTNKEYGGKQEFLVGNIGTENSTGSLKALNIQQSRNTDNPNTQVAKQTSTPQNKTISLSESLSLSDSLSGASKSTPQNKSISLSESLNFSDSLEGQAEKLSPLLILPTENNKILPWEKEQKYSVSEFEIYQQQKNSKDPLTRLYGNVMEGFGAFGNSALNQAQSLGGMLVSANPIYYAKTILSGKPNLIYPEWSAYMTKLGFNKNAGIDRGITGIVQGKGFSEFGKGDVGSQQYNQVYLATDIVGILSGLAGVEQSFVKYTPSIVTKVSEEGVPTVAKSLTIGLTDKYSKVILTKLPSGKTVLGSPSPAKAGFDLTTDVTTRYGPEIFGGGKPTLNKYMTSPQTLEHLVEVGQITPAQKEAIDYLKLLNKSAKGQVITPQRQDFGLSPSATVTKTENDIVNQLIVEQGSIVQKGSSAQPIIFPVNALIVDKTPFTFSAYEQLQSGIKTSTNPGGALTLDMISGVPQTPSELVINNQIFGVNLMKGGEEKANSFIMNQSIEDYQKSIDAIPRTPVDKDILGLTRRQALEFSIKAVNRLNANPEKEIGKFFVVKTVLGKNNELKDVKILINKYENNVKTEDTFLTFKGKPLEKNQDLVNNIVSGLPKERKSFLSGKTENLEFHHITKNEGIILTREEHAGIEVLQGSIIETPNIKGSKDVLNLLGEKETLSNIERAKLSTLSTSQKEKFSNILSESASKIKVSKPIGAKSLTKPQKFIEFPEHNTEEGLTDYPELTKEYSFGKRVTDKTFKFLGMEFENIEKQIGRKANSVTEFHGPKNLRAGKGREEKEAYDIYSIGKQIGQNYIKLGGEENIKLGNQLIQGAENFRNSFVAEMKTSKGEQVSFNDIQVGVDNIKSLSELNLKPELSDALNMGLTKESKSVLAKPELSDALNMGLTKESKSVLAKPELSDALNMGLTKENPLDLFNESKIEGKELDVLKSFIGRETSKRGNYIGGSYAVELQEEGFRKANDVEVYFKSTGIKQIDDLRTYTEGQYVKNLVKDYYVKTGRNPENITRDVFPTLFQDKLLYQVLDVKTGQTFVDVIARNPYAVKTKGEYELGKSLADEILNVKGINVRKSSQVINDKRHIIRLDTKGSFYSAENFITPEKLEKAKRDVDLFDKLQMVKELNRPEREAEIFESYANNPKSSLIGNKITPSKTILSINEARSLTGSREDRTKDRYSLRSVETKSALKSAFSSRSNTREAYEVKSAYSSISKSDISSRMSIESVLGSKSPTSPKSPSSPKSQMSLSSLTSPSLSNSVLSPTSPTSPKSPSSPKSPLSPTSPTSPKSPSSPSLSGILSGSSISSLSSGLSASSISRTKEKPPAILIDLVNKSTEGKRPSAKDENFLGNVSEIDITLNYNRQELTYGQSKIDKLVRKDISLTSKTHTKGVTGKNSSLLGSSKKKIRL